MLSITGRRQSYRRDVVKIYSWQDGNGHRHKFVQMRDCHTSACHTVGKTSQLPHSTGDHGMHIHQELLRRFSSRFMAWCDDDVRTAKLFRHDHFTDRPFPFTCYCCCCCVCYWFAAVNVLRTRVCMHVRVSILALFSGIFCSCYLISHIVVPYVEWSCWLAGVDDFVHHSR